MKAIIPRTALASALGIVKNAAGKGQLPILANVRIETLDKSLKLTCTDLDTTLTTLVDADVKARGDTTVPCATLHELVKSFADENVTLDLDKKKTLSVTCGKSHYDLGVLDPEEFPPGTKLDDAASFKMPQDVLLRLLASTEYPTATADKERVVLHGTYCNVNGEITLAATDGRRLAVASADLDVSDKAKAIIPKRAVDELLRLLSDDEKSAAVNVSLAEKGLRFKFGDITLTSKAIVGTFPNYKQIIPDMDEKHGVTVGRADLLTALQRVALIAEKAVIEVEGQMLTVSGRSGQKNIPGKAQETLLIPKSAKASGAFNTRYLIDALSATTEDEILLFLAKDKPGCFRSKDSRWLGVTATMADTEESSSKTAPEPATKEKK